MTEFLTPSMPEPPRPEDDVASPEATEPPAAPAVGAAPAAPPELAIPAPPPAAPAEPSEKVVTRRSGPGALGRLISLIVSVGLAWALTVAITAWLLGLFLSRG